MVRIVSDSSIFTIRTRVCRIGDHIGGLLCLLASAMNGDGGTITGVKDPRVGAIPTKRVHFPVFYSICDSNPRV